MKENQMEIDAIFEAAGLEVVKTTETTMLEQMGASFGTNSCSVVVVMPGG